MAGMILPQSNGSVVRLLLDRQRPEFAACPHIHHFRLRDQGIFDYKDVCMRGLSNRHQKCVEGIWVGAGQGA